MESAWALVAVFLENSQGILVKQVIMGSARDAQVENELSGYR